MLTQTSEYALQAMAYVAAAPEKWHEVRTISTRLGIPSNYLSKILGQLAKQGLLESRKGWGGGFRIGAEPEAISLERVILTLDGVGYLRNCAFGLTECSDEDPCPLHDHWKRIKSIHTEMLQETTVADLVSHRGLKKKIKRRKKAGARKAKPATGRSQRRKS